MSGILSTLSSVVETAKKLRDLSKKIQDAETRNLIADLNLSLADLKIEVAELREENQALQSQAREAQQAADLQDKLEMRGGLYYFKEPVAGREEGPYCPSCYGSEQKLMPLQKTTGPFRDFGAYKCPACNAHY